MARKPKFGPYNYERILGQRDYTFTASVDEFVQETQKRMRALALQSTQELINYVQTPVGKGGRMRVDTGFLRASGQMSLTGMPTGPVRGRKRTEDDPKGSILYPTKPAAVVQLGNAFELGASIYFGWTANYAKYREAYDGFLIAGVQQWQQIVNGVCAKIKARSPAARNNNNG